ncbi:MAG TPA: adenosylcobinamide-GDP ribazoletransferase, partial [Streptosporangiaceae bacterium]
MTLLTVIPVPGRPDPAPPTRRQAGAAMAWAPAVGLALGGAAAAVLWAGARWASPLLGAVLAIAALAALTGGLHLDGLADTADGLGSRRPAAAALDIMRRSDVGPMGVAALVLVLLIQVTALAAVPRAPAAGLALALAAVTSRVAVVLATGSAAARPGGFGALIAGQTTARGRAASVILLGCAVAAAGAGLGGAGLAWRGLAAAAAGLLAGSVM